MSQLRYIVLTVCILIGGLTIALLVDDLEIGESPSDSIFLARRRVSLTLLHFRLSP